MNDTLTSPDGTRTHGTGGQRLRILGWSAAAALLLLPLVAMQFTDEVNWTASDFAFAAVLFGSVGGALELVVRRSGLLTYRLGAGVAILAAFLLIWVNAAVGLIGSEGNDWNLLYGAVLAVALLGGVLAGFRARGMAVAMLAAAVAQVVVTAVAVALGTDEGVSAGLSEIVFAGGGFGALWLASAALFRTAAREATGTA